MVNINGNWFSTTALAQHALHDYLTGLGLPCSIGLAFGNCTRYYTIYVKNGMIVLGAEWCPIYHQIPLGNPTAFEQAATLIRQYQNNLKYKT